MYISQYLVGEQVTHSRCLTREGLTKGDMDKGVRRIRHPTKAGKTVRDSRLATEESNIAKPTAIRRGYRRESNPSASPHCLSCLSLPTSNQKSRERKPG